MIAVESAGLTDVGRKRKGNEDAYLLDEQLNLYIVADGMGGHQAGEVASELVVKTIQDYMLQFREASNETQELAGMHESQISSDRNLSPSANRLISGVNLSNRVVYQTSNRKSSYRGMGSTVSAIYFTDETLIAVNVGDSPIYLMRDGTVEILSVPHTVLAEQENIDPADLEKLGKSFSHMLTRAMGIEESVKADICELQCFKGDILVIASDGLTDKLSPEEIQEVVTRRNPEKACQVLVDMANERGGEDNITVIVLRIKAVEREKEGMMKALGAVVELLSFPFKKIFK